MRADESYIQELKSGSNNILVAVRVRPLSQKELSIIDLDTVKVLDSKMVVLLDPENEFSKDVLKKNRSKDLTFAFDVVFDKNIDQKQVYENTTQFLIDGLIDGYNATVFAYGATGAGKTYTMTGSSQKTGIIPRTLNDLFLSLQKFKGQKDISFKVSYLEIYNETIRDLLTSDDKVLDLREDGKQGQVIAGISEVDVSSTTEILTLLKLGNRNRAKEPTAANEHSTRSHAILQVQVEVCDKGQSIEKEIQQSKLSLVDLAGSERAAATQNRGQRMLEGAKINQSLLVLGNCIQALCSQQEKNKQNFIPYRGSKLTRLLKDSLGGNCRTVMIANISPSVISFEDTYNTLNYANRAKNIKTIVNRNVLSANDHLNNYAQILEDLRIENEDLKKQLVHSTAPQAPQYPNQPKLKLLPSIGGQPEKEPTIAVPNSYKEIETIINKHFNEEKELLTKVIEVEDNMDNVQLQILKAENSLIKIMDPSEKTKVREQIEHDRLKLQTLEIDLTDLNLQFNDITNRRKSLKAQLQKCEVGTNILVLQTLIKQNQLQIQNLQYKHQERRGDIQTKQKELEIEFLQNQLKLKDQGHSLDSKVMKHIFSVEKMEKQSLLPQIKKGRRSPTQVKKKRYDYRELQLEVNEKGRNKSFNSLSPTASGKENDHHDFSLQDRQPRAMSPSMVMNKQRSLAYLPETKKKKDTERKIDDRGQSSPKAPNKVDDLNEEEIKKLRLKRLNLRIKQNKYEQH